MGEAGLARAWEGNVTSPGILFVNGINLGLTDKKEVLIIIIWYILTSRRLRNSISRNSGCSIQTKEGRLAKASGARFCLD